MQEPCQICVPADSLAFFRGDEYVFGRSFWTVPVGPCDRYFKAGTICVGGWE